MKRLFIGSILAALAAAVVSSCRGDPTASLRTGLKSIAVNPSLIFMSEGDVKSISASPLDDQLNPVDATVSASSQDASVVTVAENPDAPSPTNSEGNFTLTGVAPGRTNVDFSSGGVTGTAVVNVLPASFAGAISSATPAGGSDIVIHATNVLKFDPAEVAVSFSGLSALEDAFPEVKSLWIYDKTTDSLVVPVPFGASGPLSIEGIDVTYVPGLLATLSTATAVTQTGRFWTGDDAYATAPTLTLPANSGDTIAYVTNLDLATDNSAICPEVVFGFGSSGPCAIYKFTVGADTDLNFQLIWAEADATDIDFYMCPDATTNNCFEDGGGGATGNDPENTGGTFAAGTHYVILEKYAGPKPANMVLIISKP